MALNVNREVEDSFYRYKMPRLLAKIEGKGNGIKTVIPNMMEVARALNRPPSYTTKYFGCELGAQVQMYPDEERYIVNGAFDAPRLQDLLDGFIKKFVLCSNCTNPETDLRVTSKKTIEQTCIACGHRTLIPLVHKLTTFIINNPPNAPAAAPSAAIPGKAARRIAKTKKPDDKSAGGASSLMCGNDAADGQEASIVPGSAVRSNVSQRAHGGTIDAPELRSGGAEEDDVDWSEDTSEAAVRARAEALGSGVTGLTMTEDLEKSINERLAIFDAFVAARSAQGGKFPAKEVLGEADRLDCKEKGVKVLASRLWNHPDLLERIKAHTPLFARFTTDNIKAQKYLLEAVETIVDQNRSILPKVAKIFKALYDSDLIDEEVFVGYTDKAAKHTISKDLYGQILEKITPFLAWLAEASESESDEGGGDDDVQVVYENSATPAETAAAAAIEAKAAAAASPEDDIDIDAI